MGFPRYVLGLSVFVACSMPGLSHAGDCYEAVIRSPSPFMGNNDEVFQLSDGSIWEVKYEYEYMYEYLPSVIACPSSGKLGINGKTLNVQLIQPGRTASKEAGQSTSDFIEAQIDGDFEGWEGETIFKLTNGQIWQQDSYAYTYSYAFMPRVTIYEVNGSYEMQVEGVSSRIRVKRLR